MTCMAQDATSQIPISKIDWSIAYRIISSLFPPSDLYARVAPPEDFDALNQLESMTNERLRDAAGEISIVKPQDKNYNISSVVMAAFSHPHPEGSRFADANFGVYYCSKELETAIAETSFHKERFMRATSQPPMDLSMRVYITRIIGSFHDISQTYENYKLYYSPTDYSASQQLAKRLKAEGSDGIIFKSIRCASGTNAAVFKPKAITYCTQASHYCYSWNGSRINNIYEMRDLTKIKKLNLA